MAERQISIHRARPKETRIQNSIIWDDSLSPMARFALISMLSLPESWDYSVRGMAKILRINKDTMTKYMNELEQVGYLKRIQQKGNGRFGHTVYFITDTPGEYGDEPCPKNSDTEEDGRLSCPDFSDTEISDPKNPPQKKRTEKKKRTKEKPPIVPHDVWNVLEDYAQGDQELIKAMTGFLEKRAKKKKPLDTVRAAHLLINKLDKLSGGGRTQKIAILDQSTLNGWTGVFELHGDTPAMPPPSAGPAYNEGGQDGI